MIKEKNIYSAESTVIFIAIVVVSLGIYFNSLYGDFIWDDKDIILKHSAYLDDWKNILAVFTEPFFGKSPTYRPLLIVSFIIDYQLWGIHPFGYHYTNVLLHVVNALLVYLLVVTLFHHKYLALFSSMIFATHPIQTEAVAWISGRNDVILTFFSLLTLIGYIRWQSCEGAKRVFTFIGFLLAFACVLLTKESGIIVMFLIMLLDYCLQPDLPRPAGGKWKVYSFLILISCVYITVRVKVLGDFGVRLAGEDFVGRILDAFVIYAYYSKMLLFPVNQTATPFFPYLASIKDPSFIASFLFIALLTVLLILCWKRYREICFVILWIFITLLPVSGIVPLIVPIMEHRLYLGTVGYCVLVPLLLFRILPAVSNHMNLRAGKRILPVAVIIVPLLALYAVKTMIRNTVWHNERQFWLKTVEDSPFSVFALVNLGSSYYEAKEYDLAIETFNQAVRLNPRASKAYSNLGKLYSIKGLYRKSLAYHEKALELKPNKAQLYSNLGFFYYHLLKEYQTLSTMTHTHIPQELSSLVDTYGGEGLLENGIDNYKKALQLQSDNAEFHNGLGALYYLNKWYARAAEEYRRAIKNNPYYAEAYNNLGLIYFDQQQYDAAQEAFLKTVCLKPNFAEGYNNLALVYFKKQLYDKALEGFNQALLLTPHNAQIHFNLALVYFHGFKDSHKGISHLKESLRLNPNQSPAHMLIDTIARLSSDGTVEQERALSISSVQR